MAPVEYSPAGTSTRPPPALLQVAMACRNASVQSACPLPLAPKLMRLKSRFGKTGGLIRARISGTCDHGSVAELSGQRAAKSGPPSVRPEVSSLASSTAAPLARNVFRKSRRSLMLLCLLFCRCIHWPDSLKPGRVVSVKEFSRLLGIPAISIAPLCFDLGNLILNDAIASAENRPVSFDLIEAGPQRRSVWVCYDNMIKAVGSN